MEAKGNNKRGQNRSVEALATAAGCSTGFIRLVIDEIHRLEALEASEAARRTINSKEVQKRLFVYLACVEGMRDKVMQDRQPFWRHRYAKEKEKLAVVCAAGAAILE